MQKQSSRLTLYFRLCVLWLVSVFVFNPHFISSGNVLEAWAISRNMILYKEMVSFHLPLGRIPSLILYSITNWDMTLTPILGLIIGIINLYIILKFTKKYFDEKTQIISIIFFSILYWFYATSIAYYHEQLIGLFLTISIYFMFELILKGQINKKCILMVGLFASLAELSGQVASLTVIPIFAITTYFIFKNSNKNLQNFLKNTGILILGGIIPALPFIFYFISKGAFNDFLFWNVTYYLDYAGITTNPHDLPYYSIIIFYIPLILILFRFIFVAFKERKINANLIILAILGITTIPFTVFSVFHFHHFTYSLPVLTVLFAFGVYEFTTLGRLYKIMVYISLIILVFYSLTKVAVWHYDRLSIPPDFSIRNDIKVTDSDNLVANWLKENTSSDTKILVIGNAMVYVRSNRLPSTRPAHSIPYSWIPFEKIKQEVASHPADYLIVDSSFTRRIKSDYKRLDMFEFIEETIKPCYKKSYSVDTWIIWKNTCIKNS